MVVFSADLCFTADIFFYPISLRSLRAWLANHHKILHHDLNLLYFIMQIQKFEGPLQKILGAKNMQNLVWF